MIEYANLFLFSVFLFGFVITMILEYPQYSTALVIFIFLSSPLYLFYTLVVCENIFTNYKIELLNIFLLKFLLVCLFIFLEKI
jgi:hypothetical protein